MSVIPREILISETSFKILHKDLKYRHDVFPTAKFREKLCVKKIRLLYWWFYRTTVATSEFFRAEVTDVFVLLTF